MSMYRSSFCQKEVYKYEKTSVPGVFMYFSTRENLTVLSAVGSSSRAFSLVNQNVSNLSSVEVN